MNAIPAEPRLAPSRAAKILIVDDEPNIRLMIRAALDGDGHATREAADGAAALEAIRSGDFDLVILDLNMPVIDGTTVLERLKANPPAHPPRVIVVTAYGSVAAAVRATRHGAVDFVEKPVKPDDLRDTVRAVLAEPQHAIERPEPKGLEGSLDRVRAALRASDVESAESLLIRAADLGHGVPGYYNLLGVLYELRGQARLARKMYAMAIGAGKDYRPAEQNIRRIYELSTFGRTDVPVALGDGQDQVNGRASAPT